ncbi:extracellular matrix protein 1-like [Carassius auratus]|uniref:Extracellular matrix protein 1-like n=1 Tax=Carassius auratus TaxID=7957 RepID=A0A6P6LV18_CARAU|nr:extracellular matrix protein 1-like [Carassius auratus]
MIWKSTLLTTLILHLISFEGGQSIDPDVMLKSCFPPARPSSTNINAICLYGNGRPRYPASYFPPSSHAYARRAVKAVNRLESWFEQCCYGGLSHGNGQILCCAEQAWKNSLSHFCIEEYSIKTMVHECCEKKGDERLSCFDRQAPNPSYQPMCGYNAPPDRIFSWDPNTC